MSAQILDGKILAAQLKEKLKSEIQQIKATTGKTPTLYAVSFLFDPAIESYAVSQRKAAEALGLEYKKFDYSPKNEEDAIDFIWSILENTQVALFIFKPVPIHIDFNIVSARLKDVRSIEGIYPLNLGAFFLNLHCLVPPTPAAAMALLKSANVKLSGKSAVVLGRSEIVGKPLVHLLLNENLTVSVCQSKTPIERLSALTQSADVVMACVGKPAFVQKEWVKPGAIVIDVGINEVSEKIVGDVAEDVREVAGFLSPVPGGVGPVTSVMLMNNVVEAFKLCLKL